MNDTYPRVRWPHPPSRQESFAADEFGNSKVVPADAIVIERDSLYPVATDGSFLIVRPEFGEQILSISLSGQRFAPSESHLWSDAIARVSLAVHLREHPPVDERKVKALHRLIGSEANASNGELARRLLATGKVHVDVEDGAL